MREIKFRVWDKDTKRMLYQSDIEYYDDMIGFRFDSDIMGKQEDIVTMQYTGLKDKNEKEIYDGDIVDIHQTVNGCNLFVVVWDDIGFSVRYLIDKKIAMKYEYDIKELFEVNIGKYEKEVEIIGNIYENPELLEAEEC